MLWSRITDFDKHWSDLSWKFESILDGKTISQEDWCLCFSQVFQLLTSVDTDSLDKVHEKLYSFFKNYLASLSERIQGESDNCLLRSYRNAWVTYRENLLKFSQIFGTTLFEPYRSSSMLPSALYLPSLSNNSDDIQSDAEISSVYDIGVLYWQNVVARPMSDRLLRVLMDAIKQSWTAVVGGIPDSIDDGLEDIIVDVALTFSQRPGELFAAIRGMQSSTAGGSGDAQPAPTIASVNVSFLGPLLKSSNDSSSSAHQKQISNNDTLSPAYTFVNAYQQLLKEFAVLSHDLDVSVYNSDQQVGEASRQQFATSLRQLSRFLSSEVARVGRIFGATLSTEIVTVMEELFLGGTRRTAIEKFLADEAASRGLCQDVASLFAMISVLPSGKRSATSVLAHYISGLSKIILDNRPPDVASSPESFVAYFGGQLMNLRKSVESTFTLDGMSEALLGAVVRAAEDVLAKLSAENLCPEDFTARYIDLALKRCSGNDPTNPEFVKRLDSFVGIFTYLTEKTLYQKYHAKLLFRRLVFGLSPSLELERAVHRCMSDICSTEYCVYLNRTLNEVERSMAMTKEYVASLPGGAGPGPSKFSALILSQHIWPLGVAPVTTSKLPAEFNRHIEEFNAFYGTKRERARLNWLNGYATAEIRLLYSSPRPVTLVANMAYVAVLLSYSDVDSRTSSSLAEASGLSLDEIARVAGVLVDQKLLTVGDQAENGENVYALNLAFTSRHQKLRLLTLAPAGGASGSAAPTTPKPLNNTEQLNLGDSSMDLDQSRGRDEPTIGRAALIEKLVTGARDRVTPQSGFTCMDILRCVLANPELTFTPSPNEIHLCLQRLTAIGFTVQLSTPTSTDNSNATHAITYKFA